MYAYHAELYCDACGRDLVAQLKRDGGVDEGDSDGFPQSVPNGGEADSPDHCAADDDCLEPLDLREWGLDPAAPLYGAERPVIGGLLDQRLTEHGVAYLKEMLAETERTPYQRALHRFWRAAYADDLS